MSAFELTIVIGMAVVTIIPRLTPLLFANLQLPKLLEEWLKCIPFAALAVLIFPAIFSADPENIWVGVVGGAIALGFALLSSPPFLVVIAAVLGTAGFVMLI